MTIKPDGNDLDAIRSLKGGDLNGLVALIDRYQGKAIRTAFLVTHDETMAEDVVQDTFVRFYERVRRFDDTRPFEPYFMRSVVNAALNAMRREARGKRFPFEDPSELEALLDKAASATEQVEAKELNRRILEALRKLPPRQRAAIVQRYYLEMSEKEMAAALKAPAGTVKWLLSAARKRLRNLLDSERNLE
jgi:RNA polymerase sigma-70 factor (ECF subfamily)